MQTPIAVAAYAAKWNRDPQNNFVVACIDQNSDEELREAARAAVDETDMETWHMDDAEEWYDAIRVALWERGLV